jgi:hypothetical protein
MPSEHASNLPRSSPVISGDRLYGITMRPQELALYGERISCEVRYSGIVDDEAVASSRHYKLLVLEIEVSLPGATGASPRRLQLLKCGWELELTSASSCRVDELSELDEEVPLLLARIADTVNELARRAGLEAPLGPELVAELVQRYRSGTPGNLRTPRR